MNKIYLDYAASTPTDPEVVRAMLPYFTEKFANPASRHDMGSQAARAVNNARQTIADFIGADLDEIYFTGSGTESNNLALIGVAKASQNKGNKIVTTVIEHPSIQNACLALESAGWAVEYLPVDENGQISLENIESTLTDDTVLFSIHYGNSELGTLPPIKKIADICHKKEVLLHVDACQAMPYMAIDVKKIGIDLLTFNGSKLYGPKGIAVLYVRAGVNIFPIIYGGGQEKSLRSGTLNVPAIIGLAKACELADQKRAHTIYCMTKLRDELQIKLEKLPNIQINCKNAERLPNHLSVTFKNVENLDLVKTLDKKGIAVSSGSACSSKELVGSYVLHSIRLNMNDVQNTIRISLGRGSTQEDCIQVFEAIASLEAKTRLEAGH